MCGIFGWIAGNNAEISKGTFKRGIEELLLLSETRGKEASGICCVNQNDIKVYKRCVRARKLIHMKEFQDIFDHFKPEAGYMVMGHARMVTNGSENIGENNQPVIRNELVCIHNGIIVNDAQIWDENPDLTRRTEVDTEVFLGLMEKHGYQDDLMGAFDKCINTIKGSLSVALVDRTSNYILLYTNVGSLYLVVSQARNMLMFASEKYILEQAIKRAKLGACFHIDSIKQIPPKKGVLVDIETCQLRTMSCRRRYEKISKGNQERTLVNLSSGHDEKKCVNTPKMLYQNRLHKVEKLLEVDVFKIRELRRCSKCLLPETFPGITFDEAGECSVCREYKKKVPMGEEHLKKLLENRRTKERRYDCIVPLSGGRDSCYMLHYIVKELGLKPVAYTYDWGMVTDLARRNIQRMCSELGVEHILISANIAQKRKNIQLNVKAWLRHPDLMTVPLFMAGDKQFFYYAQMLKHQMRVDNIIFGMNSLEETQFKVRFASIQETGKNGLHYNLSAKNKYNLMISYAKEFVKNPAYINRSLLDSFTGFVSYYFLPKDYIQFFDYIKWHQDTVEDVILNQYEWEKAKDTDETWRIGDGTAPFYNYIYYRLAGFTEFDTFKSNQIREGMVDRETAFKGLERSNRVSAEGFVWYCDTINVDPIETLKIINNQKTLYDN
jgi:glucosamine--fructose-6-phosphate aminotransferase (isomerizing)